MIMHSRIYNEYVACEIRRRQGIDVSQSSTCAHYYQVAKVSSVSNFEQENVFM